MVLFCCFFLVIAFKVAHWGVRIFDVVIHEPLQLMASELDAFINEEDSRKPKWSDNIFPYELVLLSYCHKG